MAEAKTPKRKLASSVPDLDSDEAQRYRRIVIHGCLSGGQVTLEIWVRLEAASESQACRRSLNVGVIRLTAAQDRGQRSIDGRHSDGQGVKSDAATSSPPKF